MNRREVITLIGGAAAWPIAARAQQPVMALVGLLSSVQLDDRQVGTSESQTRDMQVAARALGIDLLVLNASSERNIDAAFASFVQQRVNAVVIGADSLFVSRRDQLVGLAARHTIPAIYFLREFADIGGLMSYGASQTDAYRVAGGYTARILKGENPAALPVQQTVKFEFVINLKAAEALGLTVPTTLLAAADEVIE